MDKIKTFGPYRISLRFQTGEEWTFVLDDLSHARVMDEFFSRFAFMPSAPTLTSVNMFDATGQIWRGL